MQIQFGPAVGILEMTSLASGYAAMDLLVKKAPVRILEGSMMSPGKFFILINGDEASVFESFNEALQKKEWGFLDSVLISQIDPRVLPAMYGLAKEQVKESLLIVETASMSSGIISSDAALKSASVEIIELRTSRGIGGKSVFFLTGALDAVEAARESVSEILKSRGTLLRTEIIARPHQDFLQYFNLSGEA